MESTKPYGEGSGMIFRICGKIMTKLDILIPMEEKKGQKKRLKELRKKTRKLKKRIGGQ